MPRARKLNREDITPEKLRQFEGFELMTDEETQMICEFTIQYCSIIHQGHEFNKKAQSHEKHSKRF